MTTIQTAGYVVTNNEAIWGVGATADAAWSDFENQMEMANVSIVGDAVDDMDGSWTRESDYTIRPATAALLAEVDAKGGNIGWSTRGGVACTRDEADAA